MAGTRVQRRRSRSYSSEASASPLESASRIVSEKKEDRGEREIGDKVLLWRVSSAKLDNGVWNLRDGKKDTFWQSDGCAPHWVRLEFGARQLVSRVSVFVDYKLDESYTPLQIELRAAIGEYSMQRVAEVSVRQPSGWVHLIPDTATRSETLVVAVLVSHQNGKNTHLRQLRVFGSPKMAEAIAVPNTATMSQKLLFACRNHIR